MEETISNRKIGLIENTETTFRICLETMKRKNSDYAGKQSADGLKNFEVSAQVAGITVPEGILVRLMDKMTRIGNLLQQDAQVKDESIQDTLMDAINYSAILLYAIKQEKNG
jgi:hypothetical protein